MRPVITSLLETDLYKFTMWQAMLHRHPSTRSTLSSLRAELVRNGSLLRLHFIITGAVGDLLIPDDQLVTVAPTSSALDVEAASLQSGRSRLAVVAPAPSSRPSSRSARSSGAVSSGPSSSGPSSSGPSSSAPSPSGPSSSGPSSSRPPASGGGEVVGVVHVREAVRATTAGVPATAAQLMDPPFDLDASVTVTDAVTRMRAARAQLAMVTRDGERVGFVALEDLLEQVIGEFDDETDPVPVGRRMR